MVLIVRGAGSHTHPVSSNVRQLALAGQLVRELRQVVSKKITSTQAVPGRFLLLCRFVFFGLESLGSLVLSGVGAGPNDNGRFNGFA